MRQRVKVAGWDLGTGPGPVAARNVQLSGSLAGGHGAASFDVYTGNAYLAPHHVLTVGNWVVIYDEAHELYEGEVLSVKPVVTIGGQHLYRVTCGGLLSVAGRRRDLSKTWVRRGGLAWRIHPDANKAGEYTVGAEGTLQLMVREGATESFVTPLRAWFLIDDLLSDDFVSHVAWTAAWDTTTEGGYTWAWRLYADALGDSEANTSSTGTANTYTPVGDSKSVEVWLLGDDAHTVSADRYVTFSSIDVYGSSETAKVRIDEAMVDVATRTGLATSSVSSAVGEALDDLYVAKTSAAGALETIAALNHYPFDWGFWDEKTFYARPLERRPTNPARVVVVGGGRPGLVSWDVSPEDEDVPAAVMVLFGNKDDPDYPEGFVRRIYVPAEPADTADVSVETVDFSNLILSDAAAACIGAQLLGGDGGWELPEGAVLAVHPEYADGGQYAGNNTDPTSTWAQTIFGATGGTLTSFDYTAASGWAGQNSPLDPTCLVFDGADNYVTFGDYADADVGTGAISVACWFCLNETGKAQTLVGKMAGSTTYQGWKLLVTSSDNLVAWVAEDVASAGYEWVVNAETLVAGTWYFACFTWDGTTDKNLALYLNAVSDDFDSVSAPWTGGISNSASLKLGAE